MGPPADGATGAAGNRIAKSSAPSATKRSTGVRAAWATSRRSTETAVAIAPTSVCDRLEPPRGRLPPAREDGVVLSDRQPDLDNVVDAIGGGKIAFAGGEIDDRIAAVRQIDRHAVGPTGLGGELCAVARPCRIAD